MNDTLAGCPSEEELAQYVHDPSSSGLEEHVGSCVSCRSAVAALADLAFGSQVAEGATLRDAPRSRRDGDALPAGTLVGRYVIVEAIGAGAMGTVYAARDPELDRKVALKVLRAEHCRGERASDLKERLVREARAMAKLAHPEVITVYDAGAFGDQVFIAMELVTGGTLRDALAKEPKSWRRALALYLRAGRGLAAAHAAGLIHRDFKPDNVLVGDDGRVRVSDFGLARAEGFFKGASAAGTTTERPSESDLAMIATASASLTRTGTLVGTPAYMSPEQMRGEDVDARSDIYSFSIALYEALYGERPFSGSSLGEIEREMKADRVRDQPSGSTVPLWIRRALLRGLRFSPSERPRAIAELLDDLERDPGKRVKRALAIASMTMLVIGAAALGYRFRAPSAAACDGGAAKLAGVWDDARRAEVEKSLRATGAPFAAAAWTSTARALDVWSAHFTAAHRDACLATRVRGDQSEAVLEKRMSCLARKLERTRAAVDLLAHADAQIVAHATESIEALPPLEECADLARLLAPIALPSPADAPRVEALRKRIDAEEALEKAGKYRESVAPADANVEEAKKIGYAPVVAVASFRRSIVRGELGDVGSAEEDMFESLVAAEAGGSDYDAADAWTWLVSMAADAGRYDESHKNARHAAAAIARAGGDARRTADLENHMALALIAEGKLDEAEPHFQRDLAYRQEHAGPLELSSAYENIGVLSVRRGDFLRAEQQIRKAIEINEKGLGPGHPSALLFRKALAQVLLQTGRFDEAIALFRELRDRYAELEGPHAHETVEIAYNLGGALEAAGRYDESLVVLGAVLEERMSHGASKDSIAYTNDAMAGALAALGRYDEALARGQAALSLLIEAEGANGQSVPNERDNVASILVPMKRIDEAIAQLELALPASIAHYGPKHPEAATIHTNFGNALLAKNRLDDARAHYEAAIAIWEPTIGERNPRLGEPLAGLGRIETAKGHADKAVTLLERSLAVRTDGGDDADVADSEIALAEAIIAAHRDAASVAKAREHAESAREKLSKAGRRGELARPAVDAWLTKHR